MNSTAIVVDDDRDVLDMTASFLELQGIKIVAKDALQQVRRLEGAQLAGNPVVAHGGVLAQAWRGLGPRQALLAKALDGIDIRPIDRALGRATGELLSSAGTSDIVDAALVLLANDQDHILTSDPDNIALLARASGRDVEIIPI